MDKIKAVRIMCDWCADGIWQAPTILNSCIEGFRVSDGLWQRIQRWQEWHDTQDPLLCTHDNPDFDLAAFVAEGLSIAKAVKREFPGWIVVYHDERKFFEACQSDLSRDYYELQVEWTPGPSNKCQKLLEKAQRTSKRCYYVDCR